VLEPSRPNWRGRHFTSIADFQCLDVLPSKINDDAAPYRVYLIPSRQSAAIEEANGIGPISTSIPES
jgi:hypothetical protein